MDARVGSYLVSVPLPFQLCPVPDADKALVIVETRPTFFLPHVVATAVRTHPDWQLYVFGTPEVHDLLNTHCKNYASAARQITLNTGRYATTRQYSEFLTSAQFWDCVQAEHVLVFQSDCVLVRPTPPEMLQYDFVGAVCGRLHPAHFHINGGLSLRRRSSMVRAIQALRTSFSHVDPHPEDVAFVDILRRTGGRLPTMDVCDAFAIESRGDPDTAVGMHGTDKYYAPADLVARLLLTRPRTEPAQT